jgi:hypothetical protein
MNKNIIAILIGVIAILGGALAAFLIIRKKFASDDDFDEFEDFDMIGDDEFFDEDEFFGEEDGYSDYVIGNDNSMPFVSDEDNGTDDEAKESL